MQGHETIKGGLLWVPLSTAKEGRTGSGRSPQWPPGGVWLKQASVPHHSEKPAAARRAPCPRIGGRPARGDGSAGRAGIVRSETRPEWVERIQTKRPPTPRSPGKGCTTALEDSREGRCLPPPSVKLLPGNFGRTKSFDSFGE